MIHDMGVGRITGYSLSGRHDLKKGLVEAMKPVKDRDANDPTPTVPPGRPLLEYPTMWDSLIPQGQVDCHRAGRVE